MSRVREFVPSRLTLACVAVCLGILLLAGIDLAHTNSRAPGLSACLANPVGCYDDTTRLQDQYDSRCWLYSSAVLAVAAVAVAYSLRARPRRLWPRIFSDLGITGVWAGIAATVALIVTSDSKVQVPAAQALTVPIALLVAAGIGTLMARSEGWGDESAAAGARGQAMEIGKVAIHVGTAGTVRRSRLERLGRLLSLAAISLTGVTVVLAAIFTIPQPDCGGSGGGPPGWTDPIDSVAAVAGIVAIAAAIGALILRRWIAALLSLVVNPIALLAIAAATCAFY
jgi:hypothetical protein